MHNKPMHWAFYRLMEISDRVFTNGCDILPSVVPSDRFFNYLCGFMS